MSNKPINKEYLNTQLKNLDTNILENKYMAKENPVGEGSFSLNRKEDSEIGNYSFAEGSQTEASGWYSHSEGLGTIASNFVSHAEGYQTTASGECSHAEGDQTIASGAYSHAEGCLTEASGMESHAEGLETKASGEYSHAEGFKTEASGWYSHAEGNSTKATGVHSHAEGDQTTASGYYSHSGGYKTEAKGDASFAHGYDVIATSNNSFAIGKCNIEDTDEKYAFSIGNGNNSLNIRRNAFAVTWNGEIYAHNDMENPYSERVTLHTDEWGHSIPFDDFENILDGATPVYNQNYSAEDIEKIPLFVTNEGATVTVPTGWGTLGFRLQSEQLAKVKGKIIEFGMFQYDKGFQQEGGSILVSIAHNDGTATTYYRTTAFRKGGILFPRETGYSIQIAIPNEDNIREITFALVQGAYNSVSAEGPLTVAKAYAIDINEHDLSGKTTIKVNRLKDSSTPLDKDTLNLFADGSIISVDNEGNKVKLGGGDAEIPEITYEEWLDMSQEEKDNGQYIITGWPEGEGVDKYALVSEAGYDLGLSIDPVTYIMTLELKTKGGNILSTKTIDFPLESMVMDAAYADGTLTLILQNGNLVPVDISAIVSGLVNDSFTIAGIDMKDDITAAELKTALGVTDLETEMANVKKSVSDGKKSVADAITAKGQTTAADATFATMATNIGNIQTGITPSGTLEKSYTTNGTEIVDCTNYANVSITRNVEGSLKIKNLSLSSCGSNGHSCVSNHTLDTTGATIITIGNITTNRTDWGNAGIVTIYGTKDNVEKSIYNVGYGQNINNISLDISQYVSVRIYLYAQGGGNYSGTANVSNIVVS